MPKRIKFEGVEHVFPDDFTDDDISQALSGGKGESRSVGQYLKETVSNVPGSAGNFLKSIPQMGTAMLKMASDPPKALGQIKQHYGERYGSPGAVLDTLRQDPVGTAADLASAGMGVAGAARGVAAAASRVPMVARGTTAVADVASKTSNLANPMSAAAAITKIPRQALGRKLYRESLKGLQGFDEADRAAIIQTGIDERIPTTTAGIPKVEAATAKIDAQVADAVQGASAKGLTGDPTKAITQPIGARGKQLYKSFEPQQVHDYVRGKIKELLTHHAGLKPAQPGAIQQISFGPSGAQQVTRGPGKPGVKPQPIPIADLWEMKKNLNKELRGKFGEYSGLKGEIEKAYRSGVVEEFYNALDKVEPGLQKLGQKEKLLIDLEKALNQAAGRQGNQSSVSPFSVVAASQGTETGAALAAINQVLQKWPGLVSRFAYYLHGRSPSAGTPWLRRSVTGTSTTGAAFSEEE